MTERAEVPQDLVRTSWSPALWVGGEGESVRSNVEKKSVNSCECNLSGWMLSHPGLSGVQSSGK